jgi:hypothetical protein
MKSLVSFFVNLLGLILLIAIVAIVCFAPLLASYFWNFKVGVESFFGVYGLTILSIIISKLSKPKEDQ